MRVRNFILLFSFLLGGFSFASEVHPGTKEFISFQKEAFRLMRECLAKEFENHILGHSSSDLSGLLHRACELLDDDVAVGFVSDLLKVGADANEIFGVEEELPLHAAVRHFRPEMILAFLPYTRSLELKNKEVAKNFKPLLFCEMEEYIFVSYNGDGSSAFPL